MSDHFLPEPVRISRRHLFKAAAVVVGALGAAHSKAARAQDDGWGHHHGGDGDGDGDGDDGGHYDCHRWRTCCFLRGTRIRTSDGFRAIETLAVGDLLPTQFSGMAPIRRIVSFTVHQDETGRWPDDCRLVRIRPAALDDGVPARDLFVTHTHAIFLDGVLVPAVSLVNGKTITFHDKPGFGPAEYFHIEFDGHDVMDAESALCESFRDETTRLCAPLVLNGGKSQLWSHLRNAAAPFMDRRKPYDLIRDRLEHRAGL